MDTTDAGDIGRRLRQIRHSKRLSLRVVAGLAGISPGYLSLIETGQRALDSRSRLNDLANALNVAPSELTGTPLILPSGQAGQDDAIDTVRHAMLAVSMGEPCGELQPIEQLRSRVHEMITATNNCDSATVGAQLPALIRDLHTAAAAGINQHEVLRLLTLAHVQCTQAWLAMVGAPIDLAWQAATEARRAAEQADEPVPLALAAFGTSMGLLTAGSFDLASSTLDRVDLPRVSNEELQLTGMLALASSLVSAARNDHSERAAALECAVDLADRTGETNQLGLGFGPSNVAVWRMQGALEAEDYAEAARIAATVNPDALTVRARRAVYWRDAGRAAARLPRQRDRAVEMLRRAEQISPDHVQRHQFTRSVIAELVSRAKRDAVGRELRGMAYRAGLHV